MSNYPGQPPQPPQQAGQPYYAASAPQPVPVYPPPRRPRTMMFIVAFVLVAMVFAAIGAGVGWLVFRDKAGSASSGDVESRRIDMACEIAFDLEGKVPAGDDEKAWKSDEWGIGNEATGLRDVSAIGALLGGMVGKGSNDDSWGSWGKDLTTGVSTLQVEKVSEAYDEVLDACKAR